jgi:hypothetical protein
MNRPSARARPRPKPERPADNPASLVFRDFVRQLERLDPRPRKPARGGSR